MIFNEAMRDKLALKCDLARSFVGEVERGKRNISLRNICKLAIALEVTTAELLSLVDDEISKL
jgi:transcriptional regulator with XRE-family HTH domain